MKKIQKRALRFIYNDYVSTYDELLQKSLLPTLKIRRLRTMAIETFKIVNKSCPLFLQDLVTLKGHSYSFRYTQTATVPSVRTTRYGLQSFRYSAPKIWNSLPNETRHLTSLNQFKSFINTWSGPTCNCKSCRS